MIKQQTINIADSNIANLGSDLERKVKEASANSEHAWDGIGEETGLTIWRIEDFNVVAWDKNSYGTFYEGDSYIVFNAYKEGDSEALEYDVHFWLGPDTTMDEAGTAAYKTVELDTKLGDKPIQHREVGGFESPLFLSYFSKGLNLLAGGVESGFNHVEPDQYEPRLLRVKGKFGHVNVRQVPLEIGSLNSGDSFILDHGLTIYQFNGASAGAFEKRKAAEVVVELKSDRAGAKSEVVDEDSSTSEDAFWTYFGGKADISSGAELPDDAVVEKTKKLFRLSDADGSLSFTLVQEGNLSPDLLDTNDVFIIDAGHSIYVWIGNESSTAEKAGGMGYAQQYCKDTYNGLPLSISLLHESGCTAAVYKRALN